MNKKNRDWKKGGLNEQSGRALFSQIDLNLGDIKWSYDSLKLY